MPTLLHCPKCNQTWDVISLHAALNGMDAGRDFVKICEDLAVKFGIRLDQDSDQTPIQLGTRLVRHCLYPRAVFSTQTACLTRFRSMVFRLVLAMGTISSVCPKALKTFNSVPMRAFEQPLSSLDMTA